MKEMNSTADRILRSARRLIVAGGYDSFSYADIATEVGIRNAGIHHHFPSKADLVRVLVAEYRKEAREGLSALERGVSNPMAQLRAYVAYWADCLSDASAPLCVCALLGAQLPILPEAVAFEVRAHFRALAAWLTSVLERGVQQGTFRLHGSPKDEAELLMASIHGAMVSARVYEDPKLFSTVAESALGRMIVP